MCMSYQCVRCGASSEDCIITVGNTGPICRGCMNLYAEDPEKWKKFPNIEPRDSYGYISFTGVTRAGPFWLQILAGQKTQTIRMPRADGRPHAIVGAETTLYWRVRYNKPKPIHKIARVKVTNYECLPLLDMMFDEENALRDGFVSLGEFRLWFAPEFIDLAPNHKEALRAIANEKQARTVISNFPVAYGKTHLHELAEKLMEPVYRISWEMVEKAKAICPNCESPQGEPDLPELDILKCTHCGHRFYYDEPKDYILVSEIKDG